MKKITFSFLSLLATGIIAVSPAFAEDIRVAATMQRCTTNEECTLVTNSCQDNCGFVPVHKSNLAALQGQYQNRCGKPMEANPTCNMNPPISAACVNSRCTIDYAYANHGGAGDYQSGAYAVPEAPTPSKVQGDYSKINDRHGFTAYDLPQNEVKESTVGTLHTTVYVPPSAPVSGGNYVPVTPNAAVQAPAVAPQTYVPAPAPSLPPAATPTNTTHATPPTATAVPYTPPQVPASPAAPTLVPPVPPSMPSDIPAMTPSLPNQQPPEVAPAATAPVPRAPTQQPYEYVAPETIVTAPPVPTPPPVPVAPPGSTPIPPSDLQPVPTFVPPPGGTIPVNPEDPGAPPPEGSKVMLKDGKLGVTNADVATVTEKDFSAKPRSETKTKKLGSFN